MGLELTIPPAPSTPTTLTNTSSDQLSLSHTDPYRFRSSTMGSGPSSPTSTAADSYKDRQSPEALVQGESGGGLFRRDGNEVDERGGVPGEINETGHIQEVERNFSLLSVCSVGIVVGSVWPALGGSIAVAIS